MSHASKFNALIRCHQGAKFKSNREFSENKLLTDALGELLD